MYFFKEAGRVSVIPFTLSSTLLFKSFIVKFMSKDVCKQACIIAALHPNIHKSARVLTHTSTYTDTSTSYKKYVYTCLHTISYTLFHKHRCQSLRWLHIYCQKGTCCQNTCQHLLILKKTQKYDHDKQSNTVVLWFLDKYTKKVKECKIFNCKMRVRINICTFVCRHLKETKQAYHCREKCALKKLFFFLRIFVKRIH